MSGIFGKDIEFDGDGITIGDKDGKVTIGGGKWPKGKAADLLPEFKKGKIVSTVNSETGLMIVVEEVEKDHFKDYVSQVKSKGFTEDANETEMEDYSISYVASKGNAKVALVYDISTETASISLEITDED